MVYLIVNINPKMLLVKLDKSLFFNSILINLVLNYKDKLQITNNKIQSGKNALVCLNLIVKQANYELYIII